MVTATSLSCLLKSRVDPSFQAGGHHFCPRPQLPLSAHSLCAGLPDLANLLVLFGNIWPQTYSTLVFPNRLGQGSPPQLGTQSASSSFPHCDYGGPGRASGKEAELGVQHRPHLQPHYWPHARHCVPGAGCLQGSRHAVIGAQVVGMGGCQAYSFF